MLVLESKVLENGHFAPSILARVKKLAKKDLMLPFTLTDEDFTIHVSRLMIRSYAFAVCFALFGIQSATGNEDIASAKLQAFEAEYSIKKSGITVGKLSRSLIIKNEDHYEFSSMAATTGIAAMFGSHKTKEASVGYFSRSNIQPERYEYSRKKGKKLKATQLIFDTAERTLKIDRRGVISERPLTTGGLDKLSYQLQLMFDLKMGRKTLVYTVETASKTKTYKADKTLSEDIVTPAGKYSAVRTEQLSSSNKRTTFWCSEELGFLPVKVTIVNDGDVTEILLTNYRSLP